MKPVVTRSINDWSEQRCVDILRAEAGFFWLECRRDPEDAHGWRRLDAPHGPFAEEAEALDAARAAVGWMSEEGAR